MLDILKRFVFVACLLSLLGAHQDVSGQVDQSGVVSESEIRDFFNEFESATQEDTAEHLIKSFDFESFVDAVIQQSDVDIGPPLRNLLLTQLSVATRREYEALDDTWTRHKIVSVLWTEEKDVAEVFVRHWSEDLTTWRTIFYLKRTDQGLKIYDWMDLALGFSTVSLTAAILRDGADSNYPPQLARGMKSLHHAMMALMQGDQDGASEWIDKSTGLAMSPVVEALRWHISAAVNLEYEPVYSLECVDKVEAFNERVIMASFMRATAHMQLGNYEHVVRHAQDYLDQYGADADTFYSLGVALQQLGRTEEAIEAFNAGLKDTPEAIDLVEELALTLPDDRKQEFVPAFKALPDPIGQFEYLADSFEVYEDALALQTLIEVASAMSEELPHLDYYRILPLIFSEQYDAAFNRLVAAIEDPKTDQGYLTYYEGRLCTVATEIGKEIDAYDICTDKAEALRTLVDQIQLSEYESPGTDAQDAKQQTERADKIAALFQRHVKAVPDDPETWIALAEREMGAENYEAALVSLNKAIQLTNDSTSPYELWGNYVRCYVELDQVVNGYKDSIDKPAAYVHFGYVLDEESDAFMAMERLHRKQFPYDPDIVYRDVLKLYDAQDFGELLNLAEKGIASNDEDEEDWRLDEIRFYRILALAYLNRTDDALIAARREDDNTRDHLRALIYAIKGQRQRFADAYTRCVESDAYFNSDLILDYVKIPEDWFPKVAAAENAEFDPYFELRRVVFLLPEPIQLSAFRVGQVSESIGLRLSEIQRNEVSNSNSDYFSVFSDHAAVVAVDQCKYFLSTGDERYASNELDSFEGAGLGELEIDDSEIDDQADRAVQEAVKAHRAWFAIDIYTWPQDLGEEFPSQIPKSAAHRLAELAKQMAGDRVTVAIHPDSSQTVVCSEEFFDALLSNDPMSAFSDEQE